jgi:exonuclease SbcD
MVKWVHAADLHLDSPLRGLERYEGAPVERIRTATRRAMENLVALCVEERADLLLLAGDLFDGNWKDYSTGLFFAAQMSKLREAGVAVVLVRGNHDAASQITKSLRLPDNVRELSWKAPETVALESIGVAVHGQSFATRAVTDDLAAAYPDPIAGVINIGLLHTCAEGREGHEPYAPCSREALVGKGYEYWALGHVHAREVLSEAPWVIFPGNLQGRHANETGPKGATVVSAEGGRIVKVEARALDVVRWERIEIDAGECSGAGDVVDRARAALDRELARGEGRTLAARVVVRGATRAHDALQDDAEKWIAEVRQIANDLGGEVFVEKVRLATDPRIDLEALARREDAVGELVRSLRAMRGDPAAIEELIEVLAPLRNKLPVEAREGEDGLRLDDPALLAQVLEDVERMLLPRVLAGGTAS